jgi:hypothetical protein
MALSVSPFNSTMSTQKMTDDPRLYKHRKVDGLTFEIRAMVYRSADKAVKEQLVENTGNLRFEGRE